MSHIINDLLMGLNNIGRVFYGYAASVFIQSALLVVVLFVIDLLLRRKVRAIFRYYLWLLVLVKLILPPTLSLPTGIGYWAADRLPSVSSSTFDLAGDKVMGAPVETPLIQPSENLVEHAPTAVTADVPLAPLTWQAVLFILWLVGVLAFSVVLAQRLKFVRGLMAGSSPGSNNLLGVMEQCRLQMGVRRQVGLRLSEAVSSPAVCGLLKPVVLMPADLVEKLSPEGLRATLIHELAHIKRGDLWVNAAQTALQVVYFYNPFVWFANSVIRKVCEEAVDETVLVALGGRAKDYSNTLIDIGEMAFWKTDLGLRLIGVAESKKALQWRIKHMLTRPIPKSAKIGAFGIIAILFIAAILLPMAKAQKSESDSKLTTGNDAEATLAVATVPAQQPIFRKIAIPGKPWDAQLSSDGKSIVFPSEGKLWIIPRNTALGPDELGVPQMVDTGGTEVRGIGVACSADGQWIAFTGRENVRAKEREGNERMFIVAAEGGKPREVYNAYRLGPICIQHISLSPDGRTLAFSAQDANDIHIYSIPTEGGTAKRLVEAPAREPVFSPDGKMIAYVEDKNLGHGGGGVWVVPAEGGTPKCIAEASNAWSPIWSPDGHMIAFFDLDVGQQIYIIPINGEGSPSGQRITIDYPKEARALYRLTGWTRDNRIGVIFQRPVEVGLYTLSLKGGPASLVRPGGYMPHWSPDGKRIIHSYWVSSLYASEEQAVDGWLFYGTAWVPAEGGEVTKIPVQSDTKILKVGWGSGNDVSPDGKTIALSGRKTTEEDSMHIWILPIEGGKPTQLTDTPATMTDSFPCWSPDGKAIAFARCRDPKNEVRMLTEVDIWIVPAVGGESRQLTRESDMVTFGSVAWSPDGRLLAYFSWDDSPEGDSVRVIPAEGGESHIVAKLQHGFEVNAGLAWSPDSRRIVFTDGGKQIKIASLEDRHVVNIDPGAAMTRIWHVDWSHDGDKLVFGASQGGEMGFWLMENFLPTK